jgi:hypothetical protein
MKLYTFIKTERFWAIAMFSLSTDPSPDPITNEATGLASSNFSNFRPEPMEEWMKLHFHKN